MAIKKDLTEQLSVLVAHIKDNTKDGSFITLTYRDIAKIAGSTPGSSVTKRLMESLKEHENILFKLNLNPSKSKKPLQFRFVDKEVKYRAIDSKRYQYLTDSEVEFIKDKLGYRDHEELYAVLSYLNYLKSEYNGHPFDLPSPEIVSDLLLILEQDVMDMNNFLEINGLLIDENSKFRLLLNHTEAEKEIKPDDNNEAVDKKLTAHASIDLQHLDRKKPREALMILFAQLESQQAALKAYVRLKVLEEIEEVEAMKKQLDNGHEALQSVLKENQELRDKNNELKSRLGKLEANFDKTVRFKEDLINSTQDFLQIFNWQVQQVALKDSNMSLSEKNSKAYRAKLFQQYIDVGQEFYNNIIGFTKD